MLFKLFVHESVAELDYFCVKSMCQVLFATCAKEVNKSTAVLILVQEI